MISEEKRKKLEKELLFSAARSSGPGGQNVNKVNTKAELRFNVAASNLLTEDEKLLLGEKLKNRINANGELLVVAQDDRSLLKNRKLAEDRFFAMLENALKIKKKRKKTAPSKASVEKRLQLKKILGERKKLRRGL